MLLGIMNLLKRKRRGNRKTKRRGKKIKNHINGIDSFWGIDKVRLYKFRGMDYLHLKESEPRFDHRQDNLYLLLLKIIRNNPLKGSQN